MITRSPVGARGARPIVAHRQRVAPVVGHVGPRHELVDVVVGCAAAVRDLHRHLHRPVRAALEVRADEHVVLGRPIVFRELPKHARQHAAHAARPAPRENLRERHDDQPEDRPHERPHQPLQPTGAACAGATASRAARSPALAAPVTAATPSSASSCGDDPVTNREPRELGDGAHLELALQLGAVVGDGFVAQR